MRISKTGASQVAFNLLNWPGNYFNLLKITLFGSKSAHCDDIYDNSSVLFFWRQ